MLLSELKSKVEKKLNDPKRYNHSLLVAQKAVELIDIHQLNIDHKIAFIAGLVHDYAKNCSFEDFKKIVKKYNLKRDVLNEPFPLLHAFLGIYIIQDELGIVIEEILESIYYHPTGIDQMSPLVEVLFVADFIEDSRTYPICCKTREIAKVNLKKAVATKLEYLLNTEETAHPYTILGYDQYKKYLKE